jgi:cbb3-type cytochrome oxidase maturation protein
MNVIIILLIISVCIAGAFLIAFIWSARDGQYDDIYSPSQRVLFDDYVESENKTEE